jgi:hypothetical protein
VDTNIIFDLLIPDPEWASLSKTLLDQASREGSIVICEAVYAEVASFFKATSDLNRFLSETRIKLVSSSPEALVFAAAAWKEYIRRKKGGIECPSCGRNQVIQCTECGKIMRVRQHIITDFLIGGHALALADVLITRDRGYYKTYFPTLKLATSS